jgi:hypothetical protein
MLDQPRTPSPPVSLTGSKRLALTAVTVCLACLSWCASALAVGDANVTTSCGETEGFPGFRAFMPDCRAYELVSPVYGGGAPAYGGPNREAPPMSADGTHLLALSFSAFAGTENLEQTGLEQWGAIYELSRAASGWGAEALEPPASQYPRSVLALASADLSRSLWYVALPEHAGEELPGQAGNKYEYAVREAAGGGKGRFTLAGPVVAPGHEGGFQFGAYGASDDLSRLLIQVKAEAKQLWPGDSTVEGPSPFFQARQSLYEYRYPGGGEPVLVGVRNSGALQGKPHANEGAVLESQCGTVLGASRIGSTYNAVSASGEKVYFTALHEEGCTGSQPAQSELYVRVGGERTVAISEPTTGAEGDCTACKESQKMEALFQGASRDGSKVFFTSEQKLLPGASSDSLYEYDFNAAHQHERVSLLAAGVQRVVQISEDGGRVYFEDPAVLTATPNANGESSVEAGANLYVYDASTGQTAFVARELSGAVDASHDGRFLVFESTRDLTGTHDTSTVAQLFEYDANTGTVARVSAGQHSPGVVYECRASKSGEEGYNCDGNTANGEDAPMIVKPPEYGIIDLPTDAGSNLSVAEDGTVVFLSRDQLTPQSEAGGENVYEYRAGNVYLISPGDEAIGFARSGANSRLLGIDESGKDVFFVTTESLAPQDTDTQTSWYDARELGGFPAPSLPPACVGDSCQGALSVVPFAPSGGGSATIAGGGNLAPPAPALVVKPRTRAQKLTSALRACAKKPKKKRAACVRQAKGRYGPTSKAKKSDRRSQ